MTLKAPERAARHSKRLDYNIGKVAAPAVALGTLGFALLKDAYDRWTAENPYATAEERERAVWKYFIVPFGIGLGLVACVIIWRMNKR